jgi:predicted extracellular nuclease
MHRLIVPFVIILFSVCSSCTSFAQKTKTIAFYNVENLFDTLDTPGKNDSEYLPQAEKKWNSKRYLNKVEHINEVLKLAQKPIIAGFCEIENRAVVEDIINHGPLKGTHVVVHFESMDQRGIDNAIIYDRKLLTLKDKGIIRFAMPNNGRPTRDIIWAKLSTGKDEIMVMVNHWPSRYGGQIESEPKRLVAAVAAKSFIDSVQNADPRLKIVFMGDLNDYPDNMSTMMVSSILEPMITVKSGKFNGTHNYRGNWHILDHIMVSSSFLKKKGIHVKKNSGKIYSPEFLLSTYKGNIVPYRTYGGRKYLGGYSDHLPVSIELEW